ncbi:hypothetical protein [Flagellimonas nanhaiensis]|uniref:Cupin domain-containing protein n=1 Tax=Flagellimonas nanhaiensis TaxID=2292706 RepID=A0A371JTI4_9FLAO|nr:hypothetical protein [Allomuricauda nanhaiensis]RDY61132.1 hypothetical protein DX873_02890 [Allomuricauda nanhaiensis]
MIESFNITDKGYHPFLIEDGWQLARLNYMDEQHIDQITKLDVHLKTDEVFVALEGEAVLIAATIVDGEPEFELELMEHNVMYNIPKGTWHNIAMQEGSELFIAEKSNTHVSDFEFFPLSSKKQNELKQMVNTLFNSTVNQTIEQCK